MTKFEEFVGQQLAVYADGEGDMAHDVLGRIGSQWRSTFGELPDADQ